MKGEDEYRRLVERAEADEEVLGLVLTGSRGRGPFARDDSDWDVRLVVRDEKNTAGADRYGTPHGSPVEVVVLSLGDFQRIGVVGSETECDRYSYVHARVVVDKLDGRIAGLVTQKATLTRQEADAVARPALGAYINCCFRSTTNIARGRVLEGRLDAAESISPFLTALFALHGRVRPFNKFLLWELDAYPLGDPAWAAERLARELAAATESGDLVVQQALFRDLERLARSRGFGAAFDEWEPELGWLRGATTA